MTEEREGICKFTEDTMLEVARILGDIIRIQNELDELEKCSEISQIEFVNTMVTVSTKYSNRERKSSIQMQNGDCLVRWLYGS